MGRGAHVKKNSWFRFKVCTALVTSIVVFCGLISMPQVRDATRLAAEGLARQTLQLTLRKPLPTVSQWLWSKVEDKPMFDHLAAAERISEQNFETEFLTAPPKPSTEAVQSDAKVVDLSINCGSYNVIQNVALKNSAGKAADVAKLLAGGFEKPTFTEGAPSVLIYHTHTTESYVDAGKAYSTDFSKGVVAVGEAMAQTFEEMGLKTIHIKDNFIDGEFSGAYARSREAAEAVLKKYPSIKLVLDVHRDSISGNGVEYCPKATIAGGAYAQVMMICGTDVNGLAHPNWQKNLAFALSTAQTMQKEYPRLSRPVNLRSDRFNTHLTPYTLLLEVGASSNTLAEAKRSGRAVAECLTKTMTEIDKE